MNRDLLQIPSQQIQTILLIEKNQMFSGLKFLMSSFSLMTVNFWRVVNPICWDDVLARYTGSFTEESLSGILLFSKLQNHSAV